MGREEEKEKGQDNWVERRERERRKEVERERKYTYPT